MRGVNSGRVGEGLPASVAAPRRSLGSSGLEPIRRRRAAAYGAGPGIDDALDAARRLATYGIASTVGYSAAPEENGAALRPTSSSRPSTGCRPAISTVTSRSSCPRSASTREFSPSSMRRRRGRGDGFTWTRSHPRRPTPSGGCSRVRRGPVRSVSASPDAGAAAPTTRRAPPSSASPCGWSRASGRAAPTGTSIRARAFSASWIGCAVIRAASPWRRTTSRCSPRRCGVSVPRGRRARSSSCTACRSAPRRSLRGPAAFPCASTSPYGDVGATYGIAALKRNPTAAWWLVQDLCSGRRRHGGASIARKGSSRDDRRAGQRLDPVGQLDLRAAVVARRRRAGAMERG